MTKNRVLIKGIKHSPSKDRLSLYFKNPTRGGPHRVLEYIEDRDEAVLEFEKQEDAKKVIEQGSFSMKGGNLEAVWQETEVVVENVEGVTEQRLQLYFANARRGGPLDRFTLWGEKKKALLTFRLHQDARRVVETGKFEISKGCTVTAKWKSQQKVFVQLDGNTSELSLNRIQLYFKNKKRGGPIEDITKQGDSFIIEFVDEEDAEKVVTVKNHVIAGSTLTAGIYGTASEQPATETENKRASPTPDTRDDPGQMSNANGESGPAKPPPPPMGGGPPPPPAPPPPPMGGGPPPPPAPPPMEGAPVPARRETKEKGTNSAAPEKDKPKPAPASDSPMDLMSELQKKVNLRKTQPGKKAMETPKPPPPKQDPKDALMDAIKKGAFSLRKSVKKPDIRRKPEVSEAWSKAVDKFKTCRDSDEENTDDTDLDVDSWDSTSKMK